MPDEVCPLCEGQGSGLPGYFGTMADMFTLLFAFFVLMFSMATMDPAQLPGDGGVEGVGDDSIYFCMRVFHGNYGSRPITR